MHNFANPHPFGNKDVSGPVHENPNGRDKRASRQTSITILKCSAIGASVSEIRTHPVSCNGGNDSGSGSHFSNSAIVGDEDISRTIHEDTLGTHHPVQSRAAIASRSSASASNTTAGSETISVSCNGNDISGGLARGRIGAEDLANAVVSEIGDEDISAAICGYAHGLVQFRVNGWAAVTAKALRASSSHHGNCPLGIQFVDPVPNAAILRKIGKIDIPLRILRYAHGTNQVGGEPWNVVWSASRHGSDRLRLRRKRRGHEKQK
jgi:hypothetical protein